MLTVLVLYVVSSTPYQAFLMVQERQWFIYFFLVHSAHTYIGRKRAVGSERKIVKRVVKRSSKVGRAHVISQSSPRVPLSRIQDRTYCDSDRGVGLGGHVNVTGDERPGLRGSGGRMAPRLGVGGGPMMMVERRMGDRGWLGRSTVAGGVTMGATRGRNCLVGSDVDGERMCVPSDLTSESNESCDD